MDSVEALVDVLTHAVSRDEFNGLSDKVDKMGETLEEIRKNAKGGNNWGKIASGLATAVPVAMAVAKGLGWV